MSSDVTVDKMAIAGLDSDTSRSDRLLDHYERQNKEQIAAEQDDFTPDRYKQFYRMFPAGCCKILDVGCNTGRGGAVLKKLNSSFAIDGLDCVQERLDRLPVDYSGKIYGMSTDIPVADQTYDVVLAGEFLEHLYPSDVDKTLCELQRVLRVKGRLLITTPNPYYLRNRLQSLTVYAQSHLTQHFPRHLLFRMRMHGFSNVKKAGSGKMSRYIGTHFPLMSIYGSYLVSGDKC